MNQWNFNEKKSLPGANLLRVLFSPTEYWFVIPGQSRSIFEEHDAIKIEWNYQKSIFTNDISLILDYQNLKIEWDYQKAIFTNDSSLILDRQAYDWLHSFTCSSMNRYCGKAFMCLTNNFYLLFLITDTSPLNKPMPILKFIKRTGGKGLT